MNVENQNRIKKRLLVERGEATENVARLAEPFDIVDYERSRR